MPGHRLLSVLLRSLHILAFSVVVGAYWYGVGIESWRPWLWLAIATGTAMVGIELFGSFLFLVELRGLIVFFKLALLAGLPIAGAEAGRWLLALVLVLASVGSHMRGKYRHWSPLPDRILTRLRNEG